MPTYRIAHHSTYRHTAPVAVAWQTVRLQPRREPGQDVLNFELEVAPRPGDVASRTDHFGNVLHAFSVSEPHTALSIHTRSLVRREGPPRRDPGMDASPVLGEVPALVDAAVAQGEHGLEEFRHASPLVPLLPEARALADGLDGAGTPALAWIAALGARFREQFVFDPMATAVSTPLADVLAHRRGVCQDFAQAFVSCARQHGLPAAYVSGYLLTEPPPGRPRLQGADAMHAWVALFVPGTGWVDYDPTNSVFVGDEHIVVARGRDYADVSPIRGVFSGGGVHTLYLGVTVEPVEVK
jgi:transglutaminase-like putative cysteine protease